MSNPSTKSKRSSASNEHVAEHKQLVFLLNQYQQTLLRKEKEVSDLTERMRVMASEKKPEPAPDPKLAARLNEQEERIQFLQSEVTAAQNNYAAILNSTSWRITGPLRRVVLFLRNLRRKS